MGGSASAEFMEFQTLTPLPSSLTCYIEKTILQHIMSCYGRRFCVLSSCQGQMSVSCQHFRQTWIIAEFK